VSARRGELALALVGVVVLVLGLWNLDGYPQTWFDEGSYLQVSRNFAEDGFYGSASGDGTRDYAPVVAVGPTLLMPVAGAMWLAGPDLAVARVVPVLYLVVATLLIVTITKSLFGARAAAIGLGLLVALPSLDWLATGRQVLGEVPGLTFLLLGGVVALRSTTTRGVVLAGVLLGGAMITKGQYLLILPATIVLVAVLDRFGSRQRPLTWYATAAIVAGATYVVWAASLLLLMGSDHIIENARLLRESSGGALVVFNLERVVAALKLLVGPSSFLLVLPATLAGLVAVRRSSGDRRLAIVMLWTFQTLWFGWFTFASIAWPRYAFPALAINTIFMGLFLTQMIDWLPRAIASKRQLSKTALGSASAILTLLVAVIVVAGGLRQAVPVVTTDERDPQLFAQFVANEIPSDATVDGWEPEIAFLANLPLHYPPPGTLDDVVRHRWLGQPSTANLGADLTGDYLIVGPFGRWVGVYEPATTSANYRLVGRVGGYALYLRTSE
jgi:4-amino-4-deoxy-L-arabinose transferase-like glycosyltransferase